MKILAVGKKPDVSCLLSEIASQHVLIKTHKSAVSALIHLQKTGLRYDWVVLDQREAGRKSYRLFDSIRKLCDCRVLTIPANENAASFYSSQNQLHNKKLKLKPSSSQVAKHSIESLTNYSETRALAIWSGVTEFHSPCTQKQKTAVIKKPQLTLVINNTVRE